MTGQRILLERRIERQRRQQAIASSLSKYLKNHAASLEYAVSENKAMKIRLGSKIGKEAADEEIQKIKLEREKEGKESELELDEERRIEMRNKRLEEIWREQERRKICDESEELKILKKKLLTAEVHKERAAQILEKRIRETEDDRIETRLEEFNEECRLKNLEEEHKNNLKLLHLQSLERETQKLQIQERQNQIQEETKREYENDKLQVDMIIKKIQFEEKELQLKFSEKQKKMKDEMQKTLEAKVNWIKERKRKEEEENEKMKEYETLKEDRQKKEEEVRRRKDEAKKFFLSMQAESLLLQKHEKEEYEQLLNDLHFEEKLNLEETREKEERCKRINDMRALSEAFEKQIAEKAHKCRIENEKDSENCKMMMMKFSQQEDLEFMNQKKRKLELIEHRKEIERILQERHLEIRRRKLEKESEKRRQQEEEEKKKKIIAEERESILNEHASLINFLPKSTLKEEKEFRTMELASKEQKYRNPTDSFHPLRRTTKHRLI